MAHPPNNEQCSVAAILTMRLTWEKVKGKTIMPIPTVIGSVAAVGHPL